MLLPVLLALAPIDAAPAALELQSLVTREAPGHAVLREAKSLRYAQRFYEAAALYRRIAMHLAERLRQSTGAWRESVG